eukprot:m.30381 g.30381  ORF g.30381 m.30381 type:complete len:241 (+) comp8198_c0_seq1:241-963(+)
MKMANKRPTISLTRGQESNFDLESADLQKMLQSLPGNEKCADCNSGPPTWASVPLGALICLKCSGVHRSLGVQFSFVRSISMDDWTGRQVFTMQQGGNQKLNDFLLEHGVEKNAPIADKYFSPAAELYRRILDADVMEKEQPNALTSEDKEALQKAKQEYQARMKPKKDVKPDWAPDESSTSCQICSDKFTLINRRHHCRRCGKLVCKKCAPKNNTRPIKEFGIHDPVRHCIQCYKSPTL